jgi:hypothetical protein
MVHWCPYFLFRSICWYVAMATGKHIVATTEELAAMRNSKVGRYLQGARDDNTISMAHIEFENSKCWKRQGMMILDGSLCMAKV